MTSTSSGTQHHAMGTASERRDTHQLLMAVAEGILSEPLPAEVVIAARLRLVDGLGLMLAGDEAFRKMVGRVAVDQFGFGTCSVGSIGGLSTVAASFAGAWLMHASDYDDTYLPTLLHAGVIVVPTVFALAQELALDLDSCVRLTVVGYELGASVAGLGGAGQIHAHGWHTTSVVAAPVTAAVVGLARGLPLDEIGAAMAIALCVAGGSLQPVVETLNLKQALPAHGMTRGFWSLAMSAASVSGPVSGLDGRFGLAQLFGGSASHGNPAPVAVAPRWSTVAAQTKFYPACHHIHGYLDALRQVLDQLAWPNTDEISSIEVVVVTDQVSIICEPLAERIRPTDQYAARFSIQFCLAVLAVTRRFNDDALNASIGVDRVEQLAARVRYFSRDVADFPVRIPGAVTVRTTHNQSVTVEFDGAVQSTIDDQYIDRVTDKFVTNTCGVLGDHQARELAATLADGTSQDMQALISICSERS